MTAEILNFNGITKLDLDPDRVLQKWIGKLKGVVIMGYDHDGEQIFASSYADGGTVLWLAEKMKKDLLAIDLDDIS